MFDSEAINIFMHNVLGVYSIINWENFLGPKNKYFGRISRKGRVASMFKFMFDTHDTK